MSLLVGACVVVLLAAAGWWLARRVLPELRGAARAAAALALGSAVVGLLQLVASLAGAASGLTLPALCAALSLGLLWRDRRAKHAKHATHATRAAHATHAKHATHDVARARLDRAPSARLPRGLAAALLLVLLVATLIGVGLPFKGDGGKFWGPKARELASHGALQAPFVVDAERLGFHRNYPLLGPALLAPAFAHSPQDASAGAKLVLAAWLAALLVLLATWLCAEGAAGRALAWAALGMPLLMATDVREGALSGGYLDALVALWLLLFVQALERLRHAGPDVTRRRRALLLALLAGGALAGTKLEGGVWVACAAGAAWLAGPARGRVLALTVGVALLALPTLLVARAAVPDAALADTARLLQPDTWIARLPPLLAGLAGLGLDASSFGLLPLGVLVVGWHHRGRVDAFRIWLLVAVLAFLLVVYMSTTMHLGRHLFTSSHRLLLHWLPTAALLAARPGRSADPS